MASNMSLNGPYNTWFSDTHNGEIRLTMMDNDHLLSALELCGRMLRYITTRYIREDMDRVVYEVAVAHMTQRRNGIVHELKGRVSSDTIQMAALSALMVEKDERYKKRTDLLIGSIKFSLEVHQATSKQMEEVYKSEEDVNGEENHYLNLYDADSSINPEAMESIYNYKNKGR
jgi:hypothetical protein